MKIDGANMNVQPAQTSPAQRSPEVNQQEVSRQSSSIQQRAKEQGSVEIFDKSIEQANKALESLDRRIERNVHEVTKAVMYVVRDTQTDEVIREFPPQKIQDMIAKMWEIAGLFVDEKG